MACGPDGDIVAVAATTALRGADADLDAAPLAGSGLRVPLNDAPPGGVVDEIRNVGDTGECGSQVVVGHERGLRDRELDTVRGVVAGLRVPGGDGSSGDGRCGNSPGQHGGSCSCSV